MVLHIPPLISGRATHHRQSKPLSLATVAREPHAHEAATGSISGQRDDDVVSEAQEGGVVVEVS